MFCRAAVDRGRAGVAVRSRAAPVEHGAGGGPQLAGPAQPGEGAGGEGLLYVVQGRASRSRPRHRPATNIWDLQSTLNKGDFIEVRAGNAAHLTKWPRASSISRRPGAAAGTSSAAPSGSTAARAASPSPPHNRAVAAPGL